MSKLKGILLTEGMHGMISQVEGLAKALDLKFIHEKIELNNFWKLVPPKFTPIQKFVFKNELNKDFDVVISCGRKSVIPSIYLKKKYKKKIVNIHIQDPKVSIKNFDFIVVPDHDNLRGENVLISKGALHYLTNRELEENTDYLKPKINKEKIVSLIIGGPNKYYDYDEKIINSIFNKIKQNFLSKGFQLILIPSMRTPKNIIELSKIKLQQNSLVIETIDKKAYLSALSLAKYICVTCDSTSMISEAALTGKPIYFADIPTNKNDQRIRKFRELFSELNIIKKLDNSLENWNYQKLDETNRVASIIKQKINS